MVYFELGSDVDNAYENMHRPDNSRFVTFYSISWKRNSALLDELVFVVQKVSLADSSEFSILDFLLYYIDFIEPKCSWSALITWLKVSVSEDICS